MLPLLPALFLGACTQPEPKPTAETLPISTPGTTSSTVTVTTDTADSGMTHTGITVTTTTDTGDKIYELEVLMTADDAWELWIDDTFIDAQIGWSFTDTNETVLDLNTDGPHVVAVHAYDAYNVIAGFMAEVRLNGQVIGLTGTGGWKVVGSQPPADWTDPWYDDSSWSAPTACDPTDVSIYWQDRPVDLTSVGAGWVWPRPCRDLGDAWFRLPFFIAP